MRAWILTLLAACTLVLMTMEYREGFVNKDGKDGETIFVSIASYRDVQCMDTLKGQEPRTDLCRHLRAKHIERDRTVRSIEIQVSRSCAQNLDSK
jgi:hypothetical protein